MTAWLTWLRDLGPSGPVAMVSVLASEGSAPYGPGTRMLVADRTLLGTVGGAQVEEEVVRQARALLGRKPGTWQVRDYPHGPMTGQNCGGRLRVLIEHVDPDELEWLADASEGKMLVTTLAYGGVKRHISANAMPAPLSARGDRPREGSALVEILGQRRRSLYLFGAGDIGQAIARHALFLPLRLAWFDTRPVFEMIDGVAIAPEAMIEQCIAEAPGNSAILALTHDPALDYRLIKAALLRDGVDYIGLMGTEEKRGRFLSRLERDKVPKPARDRLTCPIGIAGISGREPDVIAVSALAQIFQLETP